MKLSIADQAVEQDLRASLEGTLFQTPEKFIEIYNSGIVNRRNDEVSSIANKVAEAYLNIELVGNKLATISTDAISLKTIASGYEKWSVIVAVKNAINSAKSDGVEADAFILVDSKGKGKLFAYSTSVDEVDEVEPSEYGDEPSEPEITESFNGLGKVAKNLEAVEEAASGYVKRTQLDGYDEPVLAVSPEILNVDTSFLELVAEELSKH